MKKRLILTTLLLFTMFFSSCSNSETSIMKFTNSSDLTVTNININCYLGTNSKDISYNALSNGETVAPNESVTFTIPPLAPSSSIDFRIYVTDSVTNDYATTQIKNVTDDFTLTFVGLNTTPEDTIEFTLSDGAEFGSDD